MYFINLSNHTSANWTPSQLAAAAKYGTLVDLPFPAVDPNGDEAYIADLAEQYFQKILAYDQPAVMLQGEFTFTFALVTKLKAAGITALAACSERRVVEYVNAGGHAEKRAEFVFVRFRKY